MVVYIIYLPTTLLFKILMLIFYSLLFWFVLKLLIISAYCDRIAIEIKITNFSGVSNRQYRYAVKPQYRYFPPNFSNPPILRRYEQVTGPRVIGGRVAKAGEFPYQVSFKVVKRGNIWSNFCGGTVLKHSKVLTAAHCFEHLRPLSTCSPSFKPKRSVYAVAGCLYSQVNNQPIIDSTKYGQWRKVDFVTCHDAFYFPDNDVAIAFIKGSFRYNDFVKPIPLASMTNREYTDCTISGFGDMNPGYEMSFHPYLLAAKLEVISRKACNVLLRSNRNQFVCTNDYAGTAAGKGDSGGPLVCRDAGDPKDKGKGVLAGIVCAGADSISLFTRVSSHLYFINRNGAERVKSSSFVLLAKVIFSIFTINLFWYRCVL